MNLKEPQISILLPVYNGETYLAECIQSVLVQSFQNFELLIMNDCSTDSSLEIITQFDDKRIRYFEHKQNKGLFPSLNELLHLSQSALVRLLGQDDCLEPNCLREEIAFFDAHPEIGMSYCKAYFIDENGDQTGQTPINDLPEINKPDLSLNYYFFLGCLPGNICTVCLRRSYFEEVGFFDETYLIAGDYEAWVRMANRFPLGIVHQFLVSLRRHKKQLSQLDKSTTIYIIENRRIHDNLFVQMPDELQKAAKQHVYFYQDVLSVHFAFRKLLSGRITDFNLIMSDMGSKRFFKGVVKWLLTVNNHLYKPAPKFLAVDEINDSDFDQ